MKMLSNDDNSKINEEKITENNTKIEHKKEYKSVDDFASCNFMENEERDKIGEFCSINYSAECPNGLNETWICWIYSEPRAVYSIKGKDMFPFETETVKIWRQNG